MKVSFLKMLGLFKQYKSILRINRAEIGQSFGAKIDKAWRIYNIINIPDEYKEEPYNLRKSDIDNIAENIIKGYSTAISSYLDSKGLKELYTFYEISKVEKYSYLVVIGFSVKGSNFRSNVYYDNIRYKLIPIILLLSIVFGIFLLNR